MLTIGTKLLSPSCKFFPVARNLQFPGGTRPRTLKFNSCQASLKNGGAIPKLTFDQKTDLPKFQANFSPQMKEALQLSAGILLTVSILAVAEPAHALHILEQKGPIDQDLSALALGPEGPLVEEFWENVSRYIAYFFTVASGGAYALLKPIADRLKSPLSAFFVILALSGGAFITYLTLSAMLGLNETYDIGQY